MVSVEGRPDPHQRLVEIAFSLTGSIIYSLAAPVGRDGVLKNDCGYQFKIVDLEEMLKPGSKIPDGLIINESKSILIVLECKSDVDDEVCEQLKSFSSNEFADCVRRLFRFKTIEIVVLTYEDAKEELVRAISGCGLDQLENTIVWVAPRISDAEVPVSKAFGKHLDDELDRRLREGVKCRVPVREFLVDSSAPDNVFTAVVGRRLLVARAASDIYTLHFDTVREEVRDMAISASRLRRILRHLGKLVPELGDFDQGRNLYVLARELSIVKVLARLAEIRRMSVIEYRQQLQAPITEADYLTAERRTEELTKPMKPAKIDELLWRK